MKRPVVFCRQVAWAEESGGGLGLGRPAAGTPIAAGSAATWVESGSTTAWLCDRVRVASPFFALISLFAKLAQQLHACPVPPKGDRSSLFIKAQFFTGQLGKSEVML